MFISLHTRFEHGEMRCNPSDLTVLVPLMCEIGVSCIKSTWMVLAISLLWGRAGSSLQGKGGVVSSLRRLVCQWFAGSASVWCWAPALKSCLWLQNRSA